MASMLIFNQILMMMLMGGGIGIPVGMPPAPENPVMANVAPENCLYYSTWAGMATANPNSANHTEQLLAEEEIQTFVAELERQIRVNIRNQGQFIDPQAVQAMEASITLMKIMISHPTAMFVESFAIGPQGPEIKGGAMIHLAAEEAAFQKNLDTLTGMLPAAVVDQVQIEGSDFYQSQPAPDAPLFTWGIHDHYFILGLGANAVEEIIARKGTPAPQWLAEQQAVFDVPRRSGFTYANLQGIVQLSAQMIPDPDVAQFINAMGLDQLTSYTSVTGLDETGVVTKTLVGFEGEPKGLLKLWNAEPLDPNQLSKIPADATMAAAIRLDPEQVLETILELVGEIDPQGMEFFKAQLQEAEAGIGLRLREDVFAAFGDTWQIYTSQAEGGVLTGWTATLSVRDHRKATMVLERMVGIVRGMFLPDRGMPALGSMTFRDHTIHTFQVPEDEFFIEPAFCLTEDQLIVSLFPQAIKAHLSRGPAGPKLTEVPAVADRLQGPPGPSAIIYQDTQQIFRLVYPFLQIGARMLVSELQREGMDVNMGILPSPGSIDRHLQPSVMMTRRTDRGYELESHGTLPSGSAGATAPITVALVLPAIQSARAAARRAEASNNLKQIALALHNYHDVFRGFPAAYNTNKDGEALLSWRVHILPFVEQQQLYEQFRLDEPWNSEHNRKLIAQMPAIYRTPGSRDNAPGKTNYLGIRGEHGVFTPPADNQQAVERPIGISFRNITDGTSNTIAVVEATDELAVIWTKPDDLEPNEDNPINGLVGVRPGIFMAMFCDGSVRAIPALIDPEDLKALFTRDGGEIVQANF